MDPPSEGVDGGSDPPSAHGLRAQQRAVDPADEMLALQTESGGTQPHDERPADAYSTVSGITALAAPEPLDTTLGGVRRTRSQEWPAELNEKSRHLKLLKKCVAEMYTLILKRLSEV